MNSIRWLLIEMLTLHLLLQLSNRILQWVSGSSRSNPRSVSSRLPRQECVRIWLRLRSVLTQGKLHVPTRRSTTLFAEHIHKLFTWPDYLILSTELGIIADALLPMIRVLEHTYVARRQLWLKVLRVSERLSPTRTIKKTRHYWTAFALYLQARPDSHAWSLHSLLMWASSAAPQQSQTWRH